MLLYELKFSWIEFFESVLPSFVICVGFAFFAIKSIKYWIEKNIGLKILSAFLMIISIGFLLVFILILSDNIETYKEYNSVMVNRTYETVSGPVENFKPADQYGKGEETFSVDGVVFSYANYEDYVGYHKVSSKGGVVKSNGQLLAIDYVYDEYIDRNVILKIRDIEK